MSLTLLLRHFAIVQAKTECIWEQNAQNKSGEMLFAFKFTESVEISGSSHESHNYLTLGFAMPRPDWRRHFFKLPFTYVNDCSNLRRKQSKH